MTSRAGKKGNTISLAVGVGPELYRRKADRGCAKFGPHNLKLIHLLKTMAPRRRCPTCGSKQWHKEPSSGLIACSEGHILQASITQITLPDIIPNQLAFPRITVMKPPRWMKWVRIL